MRKGLKEGKNRDIVLDDKFLKKFHIDKISVVFNYLRKFFETQRKKT